MKPWQARQYRCRPHLRTTSHPARDWRALVGAMLEAQEIERGRLARTLHDDLVQPLVGICMGLDRAQRVLAADPIQAMEQVTAVRTTVAGLVRVARTVMTSLRPPALDDLGLVAAVECMLATSNAAHVETTVVVHGPVRRLAPHREMMVFRMIEEAWTTIQQHAQARSATVGVVDGGRVLRVTITDDGCSFLPDGVVSSGEQWGLIVMGERARQIGGHLTIERAPGYGTRLMITVPYAVPADTERDTIAGSGSGGLIGTCAGGAGCTTGASPWSCSQAAVMGWC